MLHINASSVEKSLNFYVEYLGFELIEQSNNCYAILLHPGFNSRLVIENKNNEQLVSYPKPGRVIFEVKDRSEFGRIYKKLINDSINVYAHDNVFSWQLIFADTDNNQIEISLDRKKEVLRGFTSKDAKLGMKRESIFSVLN